MAGALRCPLRVNRVLSCTDRIRARRGESSAARSEENLIISVARTRSEPQPRPQAEAAATLDDLYRYDGKAELIGGRIVPLMPTGHYPNRIASRITRSLDDHAQATGLGEAYTGTMVFAVPRLREGPRVGSSPGGEDALSRSERRLCSGRESFSPDASFYDGEFPANEMRFVSGPPTLAVEVRSENDYGPAAENEIAAKRRDYFEAGTKVMWDVDSVAGLIRSYRADVPEEPVVFGAARSLMPSRRCRVGGSRWIRSSGERAQNTH